MKSKFLPIFCVVCFCGGPLIAAESRGTALANSRDILRVDVHGGPAVPSPGLSGGASVLWTGWPAQSVGVSVGGAMHQLEREDAKLVTRYCDAIVERSISLMDGYHALRLRVGLGASRIRRTMDDQVASRRGEDADHEAWGTHVTAGAAFDVPVADLMWARVGIFSEKTFLDRTPVQGGLYFGWVWGGQWFGIGD